jgi:hypothetical protein
MSRENVEPYKREQWEAITEAGNTRDLDSVVDLLDPDVEFRPLKSWTSATRGATKPLQFTA